MGFLRDIQVKCSGTNGHILWCLFIDLYLHDLHQGPPRRLRLQGSEKGKISSLSAFISRNLSWWIKIDGGRIGNINDAKLPWKFLILFIKFHPMIYKSPLGYDNLLSTWFLIFSLAPRSENFLGILGNGAQTFLHPENVCRKVFPSVRGASTAEEWNLLATFDSPSNKF